MSAGFYKCYYLAILLGTFRRFSIYLLLKVIKYCLQPRMDSDDEQAVVLIAAAAAAVVYYDEKLSRTL